MYQESKIYVGVFPNKNLWKIFKIVWEVRWNYAWFYIETKKTLWYLRNKIEERYCKKLTSNLEELWDYFNPGREEKAQCHWEVFSLAPKNQTPENVTQLRIQSNSQDSQIASLSNGIARIEEERPKRLGKFPSTNLNVQTKIAILGGKIKQKFSCSNDIFSGFVYGLN